MPAKKIINTIENDKRTSTQDLMQEIWTAIDEGCTDFEINGCGQHNIGGSVWAENGSELNFYVSNPGQRTGAMGIKGTNIYVKGSAPADTGWLNSGAKIVVNGDSGDTAGHCAASGKIYIGGNAGTRSGALMKKDPKFDAPELWILKSTGSFSFEFMGGGTAVICGLNCENMPSILGDRACTGMAGGIVYARGNIKNLSDDVYLLDLDDNDKDFLKNGLKIFLSEIKKEEYYNELLHFDSWHKIIAKTYEERQKHNDIPLKTFRINKWFDEINGSIFSDLIQDDFKSYDLAQTGSARLRKPVWKNNKQKKCVSCGKCLKNCPNSAITRVENNNGSFEYVSDDNKCIGCGICAGVCPCSIWELEDNS